MKLNLNDFEAISTEELLKTKGGSDSGHCAGDDNGFGGTFDADAVILTPGCIACDNQDNYVDEGGASWGMVLAHWFGLHDSQYTNNGC